MSRAAALLALVLAVLAAGCGRTTTVREPDIVLRGDMAIPREPPPAANAEERGLRVAATRIAVVSHGQASDPFWAIVKRGIDDAARRTGVAVSYRAPDTYDAARMRRMIDEAISARLDGLVISLPDVAALYPAIRRAVRSDIPVVSINSGSTEFRRLGIDAHVGQPERRAGYLSGRRMARAGVRDALCVNQELGNAGLELRCLGFGQALREAGGTSRVLAVDQQDPAASQGRVAAALAQTDVDGILTLGPGGAAPALAALRAGGLQDEIALATFDLSPEVLRAVRDREILFAVDQQPYLQGFLPIVLLAERARLGVFPARGELVPTGPRFVSAVTAERVLELSRRGLR